MTRQIASDLAHKRREAARRRAHRRIAHEEFTNHGIPKAETMKRLVRSEAASRGNRSRWARQRELEADGRAVPALPGAAYMHKKVFGYLMKMDYHERMERARLGTVYVLREYGLPGSFTTDTFPDWQTRTLRALCYQRGKYRQLAEHTPAQIEAHARLELVIEFMRMASAPLMHKWLHDRQVPERQAEIARLKLHNPTVGFSI
jgi:hypothetical protein